MLSPKKGADPGDKSWSLGQPTIRTMRSVGDRGGVSMEDEIRLDTFVDTHGEIQSYT